jgi:glycine cleavage system H protein
MEFLPTKGIEYLLMLGYLALLVPFWFLLRHIQVREVPAAIRRGVSAAAAWFRIPAGYFFHRGHAWAQADGNDIRVGLDDFAHHLLGNADSIRLPEPGTVLRQGEPGWSLRIGEHVFDVLSPVDGKVVAVHEDCAESPATAAADPYGEGWLLKVHPSRVGTALTNLMPHDLAKSWMRQVTQKVSTLGNEEMGMVLQDGGMPALGFARYLGGDHWHELAAEMLLTDARSTDRDETGDPLLPRP